MGYILSAPAFGSKHILGLVFVILLICAGLILLFNKEPKKVYLFYIVIFWVLEVLKIGYMIIQKGTYPMNHLPFHLCSMPLFVWPILYLFDDKSTIKKYTLPTAFVIVLGAALAALIEPGNIIGAELSWFPLGPNYQPIISFIYHGVMILSALYLVVTGIYQPKYIDAIRVMPLTLGFMTLAMIANVLFDQDYMLLSKGNGSPIKPLFEEPLTFTYTLTMIAVGLVVIGFISVVSTTIYKIINRGQVR